MYKDILTSIFRRHEPKSFSNVEPLTFAFTKFCKTIGFYSQLEKKFHFVRGRWNLTLILVHVDFWCISLQLNDRLEQYMAFAAI